MIGIQDISICGAKVMLISDPSCPKGRLYLMDPQFTTLVQDQYAVLHHPIERKDAISNLAMLMSEAVERQRMSGM